jgi:hypothetical protein
LLAAGEEALGRAAVDRGGEKGVGGHAVDVIRVLRRGGAVRRIAPRDERIDVGVGEADLSKICAGLGNLVAHHDRSNRSAIESRGRITGRVGIEQAAFVVDDVGVAAHHAIRVERARDGVGDECRAPSRGGTGRTRHVNPVRRDESAGRREVGVG